MLSENRMASRIRLSENDHFSVRYVASESSHSGMKDWNIAEIEAARHAISGAIGTGLPTMSEALSLQHEDGVKEAMHLVVCPLYRQDGDSETLRGLIGVVLNFDEAVESLLGKEWLHRVTVEDPRSWDRFTPKATSSVSVLNGTPCHGV